MRYFPEEFAENPAISLDSIERRKLEYFFENCVIKHFEHYSFGHWALACYASLSPAMTSDLLHLMWLNFSSYSLEGKSMKIHPVAPADILLSPLFEETGNDIYEMDKPIRVALLHFLQNNHDKQHRGLLLESPESIADFLLAYSRSDRSIRSSHHKAPMEAVEWTAESYLDPSAAFERLVRRWKSAEYGSLDRIRYRDAIEKMSGRFRLHIHKVGQHVPTNHEAISKYIRRFEEISNLKIPDTKHLDDLQYINEFVSDYPVEKPGVLSIELDDFISQKLNHIRSTTSSRVSVLMVGVFDTREGWQDNTVEKVELEYISTTLQKVITKSSLSIIELTDERATKQAILDAWKKLTVSASPKDELIFYCTGISKLTGSESDHCAVRCYDSVMGKDETYLLDSEFNELSAATKAKSITAILAVNHAATPYWLDQTNERNVVFATCRQSQSPNVLLEKDNAYYSFTLALCKALEKGKTSNRNLFIRAIEVFESFDVVKNAYGSKLRTMHCPQFLASLKGMKRFFLDENHSLVLLQDALRAAGFYDHGSSGEWDNATKGACIKAITELRIPDGADKMQITGFLNSYTKGKLRKKRPILLFVFLNGDKLPGVVKERKGIKDLFDRSSADSFYEIIILEGIDLNFLVKELKKPDYRGRIQWLHIGCLSMDAYLSNQTSIFLEALDFQENIKCVFLNACDSSFVAEWLSCLGVECAIGSEGLISDNYASDFALQFYSHLIEGSSIQEAFSLAIAIVGNSGFSQHRGVAFPSDDPVHKDNHELYIASWAKKEIQTWRLIRRKAIRQVKFRYFADIHSHPSGKNFPKYYNGIPADFNKPSAQLWDIPRSNLVNLVKGLRATSYSQADVGSLVHHGGKLIFASIYPLEEGFVKNLGTKIDPPLVILKSLYNYTIERLRFLRSGKVDYFKELQSEWEFLQRKSGQYNSAVIHTPPTAPPALRAKTAVSGVYYILAHQPKGIESFREPWGPRMLIGPDKLDQALDTDNYTVFVLTIEGMHALSMVNGETPVPIEQLRERIEVIKAWPVFFVTFAHHFRNDLCAHAKSFFRVPLPWNPDQTHDLNFIPIRENDRPFSADNPRNAADFALNERKRGFTEKGFEAICHLLSVRCSPGIAEDDPTLGRRILIDTTHMSASARLEMYDRIIRPYMKQPQVQRAKEGHAPSGCIPVIASHSAYSGIATLETMIEGYFEENDVPRAGNPFNYWNINLADEDLEIIVRTGGLIGLTLDQRLLGVMFKMQLQHLLLPGLFKHPNEHNNSIELIFNNIIGMAHAVKRVASGLHRYHPDTYSFWNCLCLGTNFDGGIDPISAYASSGQVQNLRKDLQVAFEEAFQQGQLEDFIEEIGHVELLLDQFFYTNAIHFLRQHF